MYGQGRGGSPREHESTPSVRGGCTRTEVPNEEFTTGPGGHSQAAMPTSWGEREPKREAVPEAQLLLTRNVSNS